MHKFLSLHIILTFDLFKFYFKFSAATACVIQFSTGKRIFYAGFQSVACVALVSRRDKNHDYFLNPSKFER